jgi:hypothetical protein
MARPKKMDVNKRIDKAIEGSQQPRSDKKSPGSTQEKKSVEGEVSSPSFKL